MYLQKGGKAIAKENKQDKTVEQHIKTFDDLDFLVFTGQKWEELGESHAKDILVHWPDDRTTTGTETPRKDLDAMLALRYFK